MQRMVAAIIAAFVVFGAVTGQSAPVLAKAAPPVGGVIGIQGDVNCSDGVDLSDALAIKRSAAGMLPNPSCLQVAADVTCDGDVDAADALAVLSWLTGLGAPLQGCTAIGSHLTTGPSSEALIWHAVDEGDIDEPTALVYQVLAAYGDPRLPAQYQGDAGTSPTTLAVAQTYERWSELSQEQKDMVAPYFIPPSADGSWYDPDGPGNLRGPGDLISHLVQVTGTPGIRVWAKSNFQPEALNGMMATMSQLMESTKELMQRTPLDDSGQPNNGGDGALDVYIVSGLLQDAIAHWYTPDTCKNGPMYVEINQDALPPVIEPSNGSFGKVVQSLAHTLVQATAAGVDTPGSCIFGEQFRWAVEATAALTEHVAFPMVNSEHLWDAIFDSAHTTVHQHEEGGHSLWTLLAHLQRDDPQVVGEMWNAASQSVKALEALSSVTDLLDGFHKFSLELMNTSPFDFFSQAHGLEASATPNVGLGSSQGQNRPIQLGGLQVSTISTLVSELDDFSAQHYLFQVTDPQVKSVSLNNLVHNLAGTSMQILTRNSSSQPWQLGDLVTSVSKHFCLPAITPAISQFMVVFSHADPDNTTPSPFNGNKIVEARDECAFTGTVNMVRIERCPAGTCDIGGSGGVLTYTANATNLVFKKAESGADDEEYFVLESGTIAWTVSGNVGNCVFSGSDVVTLPQGKGAIRIKQTENGFNYALYGFSNEPESVFHYQHDCGSGPQPDARGTGIWLCSGGKRSAGADASFLSGTYVFQGPLVGSFPQCPIDSATVSLAAESEPRADLAGNERTFTWSLQR